MNNCCNELSKDTSDWLIVIDLGIGLFVLVIIITLNVSSNPWLRLSSIMIGMICGSILALSLGIMNFDNISKLPVFSLPIPFKYGFDFDFQLFIH